VFGTKKKKLKPFSFFFNVFIQANEAFFQTFFHKIYFLYLLFVVLNFKSIFVSLGKKSPKIR